MNAVASRNVKFISHSDQGGRADGVQIMVHRGLCLYRPRLFERHHRPNHHYIGPLLGKESGAAPEFLTEAGHPWVLISLSTFPQVGELAIARAALQALKDRPVRVLVTLSPDHSAEELGPLPSNARLSGFVPHRRDRAHRVSRRVL
jgi:UDP:flavonoid glycosyltransferase YjiC (YdhE family)